MVETEAESKWAQGRARRGQLESVPRREVKSALCAPSLQSPQAEPLTNQPLGAPTARSQAPFGTGIVSESPA